MPFSAKGAKRHLKGYSIDKISRPVYSRPGNTRGVKIRPGNSCSLTACSLTFRWIVTWHKTHGNRVAISDHTLLIKFNSIIARLIIAPHASSVIEIGRFMGFENYKLLDNKHAIMVHHVIMYQPSISTARVIKQLLENCIWNALNLKYIVKRPCAGALHGYLRVTNLKDCTTEYRVTSTNKKRASYSVLPLKRTAPMFARVIWHSGASHSAYAPNLDLK